MLGLGLGLRARVRLRIRDRHCECLSKEIDVFFDVEDVAVQRFKPG